MYYSLKIVNLNLGYLLRFYCRISSGTLRNMHSTTATIHINSNYPAHIVVLPKCLGSPEKLSKRTELVLGKSSSITYWLQCVYVTCKIGTYCLIKTKINIIEVK